MNIIKENKLIFIYLLLFLIISYIGIFSASTYLSPSLGKLYYKQIYWYLIGIIGIILISKVKKEKIYKYSFIFYLIINILLILVLIFGKEYNGTKAWFNIGQISFQPTEFMKIALILFNSVIINNYTKKTEKKIIIYVIIATLIPSVLTFLEPDTGAILSYLIISITMLYISGIDKKWFIYLISISIIVIITFILLYYYNQEIFINIFGTNMFYRIDRIINWNSKEGMQLNNSLIAISSSGILGHGFNNTPIYFPEAGTDFIFTVIASNFGLIGSSILLTLLFLFNNSIIKLSRNINRQDKCIITGTISLFAFQQILNISMTIGLLPIVGITLPLISYGGSSTLSYLLLIGLIIKIKKTYK